MQYDESRGSLPIFAWTYYGYSQQLQPSQQDYQITPDMDVEAPDQVAALQAEAES